MFSRLELLQPTIRFLVDDAIPSIKTGVRLRSGAVVDLYGLHPQPPAPLQELDRATRGACARKLLLVVLAIDEIRRRHSAGDSERGQDLERGTN